jgi:hypothetical protein
VYVKNRGKEKRADKKREVSVAIGELSSWHDKNSLEA